MEFYFPTLVVYTVFHVQHIPPFCYVHWQYDDLFQISSNPPRHFGDPSGIPGYEGWNWEGSMKVRNGKFSEYQLKNF